MNRLHTTTVAEATGPAADVFGAIRRALGVVPNAYVGIGSNSPVALSAALDLDGALKQGSLAARDIEVIKLAVSELAGCDYCLAAHTLAGRRAGLSAEAMLQVRQGAATGDARTDALVTFVREVVSTRGTVPEAVVRKVQAAGVTDAQIADALLAVASITFTNLFNRVHDTVLDFPPAPQL
jgi:uncharacterized peroxidase-related enzyme